MNSLLHSSNRHVNAGSEHRMIELWRIHFDFFDSQSIWNFLFRTIWRFIFLLFYVFSLCSEQSLARNNFLEAKINLINETDKILNSFENNERKSSCNAYFKSRLRYVWCISFIKQWKSCQAICDWSSVKLTCRGLRQDLSFFLAP